MSKRIHIALVCFVLLGFCPNIFADQIVLKNGDRFTGKILKKDSDKIVLETESAGVVTVLWAAVEKIVSEQTLNIKLADGQLVKGTVTPDNDKLKVETKDAGTVTIEMAKIDIVRNEAEQLKFQEEQDRLLNPKFSDLWTGTADVGLSLTTGNSVAHAFTAGIRAARTTNRDRITVYANVIQAGNTTDGVSETTAKAIWAGGRYDYNVNPKLFVFGSADFEYDAPQLLDLRAVFGGGAGYRAIRTKRTQLDLLGGLAYNLEYFSTGEKRNSAEALFGNDLKFQINPRMKLTQRFTISPNLSDLGRFRTQLDVSLLTDINSWLGWHITLADRYNSEPAGTAVENDMLLSTGLRVNFGRAK